LQAASIFLALLPLMPLAGSGAALALSRGVDRKAFLWTRAGILLSFLDCLTLVAFPKGNGGIRVVLFPDMFSRSPGPGIGLYFDPLAAIMSFLILSVSLVILTFSWRYMTGEPRSDRFLAGIGMATGFLLMLVTARNLLLLYAAWELVLVALCLLLIHHRQRRESSQPAVRTWVMNQVGGGLFLAGILVLGHAAGTFDLDGLFGALGHGTEHGGSGFLAGGIPSSSIGWGTFLIAAGILVRSAQIPFHLWLPVTLDAPTPVSGFMHAGIVNAGGFVLNRLSPVFVHAPVVLHGLFLVGALTAICGSAIMLVQVSVKQTLVYSTMGQMGYMFAECGLGVFPAAIFHMIAHGIFKATLFLGSGSVIHAARFHEHSPKGSIARALGRHRILWVLGGSILISLPLILLLSDTLRGKPFLPGTGGLILLFFGLATAMQTVFNLFRFSHLLTPRSVLVFTGIFALVFGLYWGGLSWFDRVLAPISTTENLTPEGPGWSFFYPVALLTMGFILVAGWIFLARESASGWRFPGSSRISDQLHDFLDQGGYADMFVRHVLREPLLSLSAAVRKLHERTGEGSSPESVLTGKPDV
jgi:NADH-quinone oxidoreductase subunit L